MSDFVEKPCSECPNCYETNLVCACLRNKCVKCGNPVGNITFTVCDKCWNKEYKENNLIQKQEIKYNEEMKNKEENEKK